MKTTNHWASVTDKDGNDIAELLFPPVEIEVLSTDESERRGDDPLWVTFTIKILPELGVCSGFYFGELPGNED